MEALFEDLYREKLDANELHTTAFNIVHYLRNLLFISLAHKKNLQCLRAYFRISRDYSIG